MANDRLGCGPDGTVTSYTRNPLQALPQGIPPPPIPPCTRRGQWQSWDPHFLLYSRAELHTATSRAADIADYQPHWQLNTPALPLTPLFTPLATLPATPWVLRLLQYILASAADGEPWGLAAILTQQSEAAVTQGLLLRRGTPQGGGPALAVAAAAADSDMGGGEAEGGAGMRMRSRGGRVSEAEAAAAASAAAATVAAATGGDRGQITRVLLQRMMSDRRRRRSSMPTQVRVCDWGTGLGRAG
jgi:hypothetical protein